MRKMLISGIITNGIGEGSYFISMKHYQNEFKIKLGFNAYPGTLNIKVSKKNASLLKEINPIKISGYKSGSKIFGGAKCYKAKIGKINGSIIIPDLTQHKNIIEFIAPAYLKSKLKIKNGDKVRVELV